jgi:hypothetical protein
VETYDNASWHSGGDFPKELPSEAGGTHIGMFLAWAVSSGLASAEFREMTEAIENLERRAISPGAFFFEVCDGKLWEVDLNGEGNAFAKDYYTSNAYYEDYESVLGANYPTLYHVPDDWDAFTRLKPTLDAKLASWRNRSR